MAAPSDSPAAGEAQLRVPLARKALAGFFLSGLLFSFLGAILPAWRHYLTQDYLTVGNYFLSMNLGIICSLGARRLLLPHARTSRILALASGVACASFVFLSQIAVTSPPEWRMAGITGIGFGVGLLNTAVFQAISPLYRHDPAATVNLAGMFFGSGCVLTALLVAGTFYVYTVPSILAFLAAVPGYFAGMYLLSPDAAEPPPGGPSLRQAFSDFRSPGAVLFALLLFFQFGNEWSIAGWLPLFLIERIGISPESSLIMLASYWLALLIGRIVVLAVLPVVGHGKLLLGSVVAALFGCTILISTNNRFGAGTGVLLVGCGFAAIYPLVVEKIGGRFPYYHPGFFNGIFSFALTGGLLAPWSLGLFADHWGIRVVMALPLLGTMMVLLLLAAIWAEAKLRALE